MMSRSENENLYRVAMYLRLSDEDRFWSDGNGFVSKETGLELTVQMSFDII